MVATQPRELGAVGDDPTPPARVIRPRRSLPGSRAVVGALLVTVAAVGHLRHLVACQQRAVGPLRGGGPKPPCRSPPAGRPISGWCRCSCRRPSLGAASPPPARWCGASPSGPSSRASSCRRATSCRRRQAEPHPELSFAIDTDRAVAGSLQPGDRIDLFATYGSGPDSSTSLVVPSAELRAVSDGGSNGLNGGRRHVLTVALADREAALALTNAVRAGELTVVRSTGFRGPPPSGPYQPAVPAKGG